MQFVKKIFFVLIYICVTSLMPLVNISQVTSLYTDDFAIKSTHHACLSHER